MTAILSSDETGQQSFIKTFGIKRSAAIACAMAKKRMAQQPTLSVSRTFIPKLPTEMLIAIAKRVSYHAGSHSIETK